jgi:hypothetical protein
MKELFYRNKAVIQIKPNTGYDSGISFFTFKQSELSSKS